MLLVPKNDTNLRNRKACSLLCLLEPIQNVASGPDSFLIASSLSLTSFNASSQLIFFHLPPTSFIGYLRRCSPWPCSRIAAPLAQCAPRLIGESNTGSWRIHTPFCTTASIAQPTEQCVHIVRLTSNLPSPACAAGAGAAHHRERQLACRRAGPDREAGTLEESSPVYGVADTRKRCGSIAHCLRLRCWLFWSVTYWRLLRIKLWRCGNSCARAR